MCLIQKKALVSKNFTKKLQFSIYTYLVRYLVIDFRQKKKYFSYIQHAPKDKLLIWKLGDGWGPICEFLNLPVPETPFPHNNKKASLWEDLAKTNKTFHKMGMEGLFNFFLLTFLSAYGVYKLFSCFNCQSFSNAEV